MIIHHQKTTKENKKKQYSPSPSLRNKRLINIPKLLTNFPNFSPNITLPSNQNQTLINFLPVLHIINANHLLSTSFPILILKYHWCNSYMFFHFMIVVIVRFALFWGIGIIIPVLYGWFLAEFHYCGWIEHFCYMV